MTRTFNTAVLLLVSVLSAIAEVSDTRPFNYAVGDVREWGTGRKESYDVAVRLDDSSLEGCRIIRIDIPVVETSGISGWKVWMASCLELDGKVNVPDILCADAEVVDGRIVYELDKPYTIPKDGVYVGYSFDIDELDDRAKAPLKVAASVNPDAFMIHTSRSYLSWSRYNLDFALDMNVWLDGYFVADAVAVMSVSDGGVVRGGVPKPTVVVRNHGSNPVESLGYRYEIDGSVCENTMNFAKPLPPAYDADVELPIEMAAIPEAGSYPWSITVTKVNGKTNGDSMNDGSGTVYVYPYLPERRPLMEEYTGVWCGWCPRGIVGMAGLSDEYPERFVGIAYHMPSQYDPMAVDFEIPTPYTGAPSAFLDRKVSADPYYGTAEEEPIRTWRDGIGVAWGERCGVVSVADLDLSAEWVDECCSEIDVMASVRFVRPYEDADFRFIYVLVADGLKGSAGWAQKNYFSEMEQYRGTDLEAFVDLPSKMEEFEFNDVVIIADNTLGIDGSIPDRIGCLEEINHTYRFRLSDAVNKRGESLVQDKNRLSVVAAVADAHTGEIVNARKVEVGGNSGLHENEEYRAAISVSDGFVEADAELCVVDIAGYTVHRAYGRVDISSLIPGLYVVTAPGYAPLKIAIR